MKISVINTGHFKLDGGAMFGIIPKKLWTRLTSADENNLCTWSMRCLLIEDGDRKILIDTGMGDKQDTKFRSHFHPFGDDTLLGNLAKINIKPSDITDVFLTHLHFDHVGGAVSYNTKGQLVPTFPNATYWSNKRQWDWAMTPNAREKASFLKENFVPLLDHQVLKFIDVNDDYQMVPWLNNLKVQHFYGHTEAMMALHIPYKGKNLVFCADLMPSAFHIGMPYVMGYDIRPLDTLKEKEILFEEALLNDWRLFFEHDPSNEAGILGRNEKGRVVLETTIALKDM